MIVEPGKKYRTVSGHAVEILTTDSKENGMYVVQGVILDWPTGCVKRHHTGWTRDGKWRHWDNPARESCALNLVECKETEEEEL